MPVCNEADVINSVLDEWAQGVFAHLRDGSELILDDCSTDGTTELIERASGRYPFIRLLRSPRDGFFASAMRLYSAASCPYVFFTDSDGQYVPADFWEIAAQIGDFDMVHGAKKSRQDPLYRLGSSFGFNALVRMLFHSDCVDVNSAFRLIRRELLEDVLPDISRLGLLPNAEMYIRAEKLGYRIRNVPIRHRPRQFGKSRGVPRRSFVVECSRAFAGLWRLRADVRRGRYAAVAPAARPLTRSDAGHSAP
jgi:glycosyltransferase involved in cell wall biosynthesis